MGGVAFPFFPFPFDFPPPGLAPEGLEGALVAYGAGLWLVEAALDGLASGARYKVIVGSFLSSNKRSPNWKVPSSLGRTVGMEEANFEKAALSHNIS